MSDRVAVEDRVRDVPAPAIGSAPDIDEAAQGRGPIEMSGVAVFPAPLTTLAAGALGALLGFATIYLLVAFRVNPLYGAGVILVLFAMALSGPKLLSDARTEAGRAVAVVLDGIAFGGTLGGLAVLLVF